MEVTDPNGCSAISAPFFFGSTDVGALTGDRISLHPQPAGEVLFVNGAAPGTTYRMVDAQGRVVAEGVMQQAPYTIATGHLTPGMHVLLLQTGPDVLRLPVMVQ